MFGHWGQELGADDLANFAGPVKKLEEHGRSLSSAPQDAPVFQQALQWPVEADEGRCQDDGAGHLELIVEDE